MPSTFNPFTLRAPPESIVCYFHTFKNNLGIKRKFKKYLKESCCLTSGQYFSIKYFSQNAFCSKSNTKIVRPVSAALSVNGLIHSLYILHTPSDNLDQISEKWNSSGIIKLCRTTWSEIFLKNIISSRCLRKSR